MHLLALRKDFLTLRKYVLLYLPVYPGEAEVCKTYPPGASGTVTAKVIIFDERQALP